MIRYVLILCLISTILVLAKAHLRSLSTESTGRTCRTPDNQYGQCIPRRSCNSINQLMAKSPISPEDLAFLLRSQCSFYGQEPYVCCSDTQNSPTSTTLTTSTRRDYRILDNPARTTTPRQRSITPTRATPFPRSYTISPTRLRPVSTERISLRKCNEFKEFAYNKTNVTNTLNSPPLEIKVSNCAFTSVSLVVNGTEAKVREFPHMAAIGFGNRRRISWSCGGTLISEQFVLSAAHCTNEPTMGMARYVRLGEHDLDRTDDAVSIDYNIIERIRHPGFSDNQRYNDIALFKLDRQVDFNGAIRPACLPESSVTPAVATVTGWGEIEFKGERSKVLLKVDLNVMPHNECNRIFNSTIVNRNDKLSLYKGIEDGSQICAYKESHDACRGDSGGPIQIYHKSHHCSYSVIGVTSFGIGCANPGIPGVYTKVHHYLDWIESIVWPNN